MWQMAAGRLGAIVDDGLPADEVRAIAESVLPAAPAPAAVPGPLVRVAGRSPAGAEPRWVVEWASWLPGMEESPCYTVWVEGEVVGPGCGLTPAGPSAFRSIGAVARVAGTTVVFGELAANVVTVATDAPGAAEPSTATQPLDPQDPAGNRFFVAFVHGDGGGDRSTWTLLDASGQVVDMRAIDLTAIGG